MRPGEKVKEQLEKLGVSVTGSRWAWTVAVGLVSLWASSTHNPAPTPSERLPAAQSWATDATTPLRLVRVLPAGLPPPDPRQRRPPCATKMGEEAINGLCWLRLDVDPPCPNEPGQVAYEHKGKCYAYALHAERLPSTGELRGPGGIADK